MESLGGGHTKTHSGSREPGIRQLPCRSNLELEIQKDEDASSQEGVEKLVGGNADKTP